MDKVRNGTLALVLAEFLFSCDTDVISIANLPIKELWHTKTLFCIGILFLVSAVGSILASNHYFFSFFRFIEGIVVGVLSVAALIDISAIFPNNIRANEQSFGIGIHYIFTALITLAGPFVIYLFKVNLSPIFTFFAFMMVLQLILVAFMMSETKGLTLEKLENKLLNHGI